MSLSGWRWSDTTCKELIFRNSPNKSRDAWIQHAKENPIYNNRVQMELNRFNIIKWNKSEHRSINIHIQGQKQTRDSDDYIIEKI